MTKTLKKQMRTDFDFALDRARNLIFELEAMDEARLPIDEKIALAVASCRAFVRNINPLFQADRYPPLRLPNRGKMVGVSE